MRCDAHVHVVASIDEHPQIPGRTFIARPALLADLMANGRPFGIDHFVITQPSFYGTDNAVLLGALDQLQGKGRGVAVVAHDTPVMTLDAYKKRGVVALRVNLYSPAAQNVGGGSDDFSIVSDLAAQSGLHVEVIAPLQGLLKNAAVIRQAPVRTVIDHYGLYGAFRPASVEGQALLALLRHEHVWIKLSSPYRLEHAPFNVSPDREWLDALLSVAADRCIWGSDWPHPPEHRAHQGPDVEIPYREISYAALVERFVEAIPDPFLLDALMWENSARLYGFENQRDRGLGFAR
ncbi:hypothetical protein EPK99_22595 [Neorhizobium lilium]|uniref:Amidohydrolase-related domain-containing protein n=1 Tax=Neorhizobium lilium TaxID=2503024 RepID=A0A444LAR1_9HYPH|nr:amidohydrolase family protein [Neorhizobium lilium]RWX74705.1 hypothetical protein EPK99_22595 [Neorhizobium lilium]